MQTLRVTILPPLFAWAGICVFAAFVLAQPNQPIKGRVEYRVLEVSAEIPEQFRLENHSFTYQMQALPAGSEKIEVFNLTFPSPTVTPHPNNNTVHCEYYRPKGGPMPAVIVLHILGGDFELARVFCHALSLNGTAALFLKMPYYGPRRGPGSPRRMVSEHPAQTVKGMTQAVLDIRRAAAWLESRSEVDDEQIGIFGISLGGITAALALSVEPRFGSACLMLAGGDIEVVGWESQEMKPVREHWEKQGKSFDEFAQLLRTVDPATYAHHARDRRILMLNARHDRVVPPQCTRALWEALGQPDIHWYDCGHYSAGWHLLDALGRVRSFFAPRETSSNSESHRQSRGADSGG